MLIKRRPIGIDFPLESEITPRAIFEARRSFIRQMAVGSIAGGALLELASKQAFAQNSNAQKLSAKPNASYVVMDKPTSYQDVTTYNNFYEFGTDKSEPARTAHTLQTHPWQVSIEGEVKKPMTLDLDSLLKLAPLEERIYRHRCVEGWSMVIPWIGYSLSALIKKVEPTANAKYVEFTSLADKKQMPGVRDPVLEWPYVDLADSGPVWRSVAEPERSACADCRALEVWLQVGQIDRQDPFHQGSAAHCMESGGAARVWILLERQPGGRPSALVAGERAPYRRRWAIYQEAQDLDVQWI